MQIQCLIMMNEIYIEKYFAPHENKEKKKANEETGGIR